MVYKSKKESDTLKQDEIAIKEIHQYIKPTNCYLWKFETFNFVVSKKSSIQSNPHYKINVVYEITCPIEDCISENNKKINLMAYNHNPFL